MCGRFTLQADLFDLDELFGIADVPPQPARFNIAPTQPVLAVRRPAPVVEAAWLRWGLVPRWAAAPTNGPPMINARSETIAAKPTFKTPFQKSRCLILADGYYEWQTALAGKQPFYIRRPDHGLLTFAGIWDRWVNRDDRNHVIESGAIITTAANTTLAGLHDRMPVILDRPDWDRWLDPTTPTKTLERLLVPYADTGLIANPVSRLVNNVRNDSPACIESSASDGGTT